jgi:hypothetical protein
LLSVAVLRDRSTPIPRKNTTGGGFTPSSH